MSSDPGRADSQVPRHARAGRDVYLAGRDLSVIINEREARSGERRVSSGYIEQVRRIAPEVLSDREAELADLADFCTREPGSPYMWWCAGGWAGKSALLSWFVLHPPPGVDVLSFFVTARFAGQSDHVAFTEVLLEQLAVLLRQELPSLLSPATREGHFLRMLAEAALACEAAGRRLVLVVDGLDEDTGVTAGYDAYSVAALLPRDPAHGLRVIVSARPDPPVPADVPADHPLRDPGIVRSLSRSQRAEVIRADAERGLRRILSGTGLEQDLLGLITAAGGGLTGSDVAEMTGESEYDVRRILHSVSGRSFASREMHWQPGIVYVLAHEDLQGTALEALGGKRLADARGRLRAWAEGFQEASWPAATPEYLLRGYFQMLVSDGNAPGALGCALDRARHDRMRELAGGDASALAEISAAQRMILSRPVPDLTAMARLARHRDELTARNAWIPVRLPAVWAGLGQAARAEELARSGSAPGWQGRALAGVAAALAAAGRYDRAEETADGITDPAWQAKAFTQLAAALAEAGHYERAEQLAWSSAEPQDQAQALMQVAKSLAAAGLHDRAAALALSLPDGHRRERALIHVAASLAQAGNPDKAQALAFAIPDAFWRAQALTQVAAALAVIGEHDRSLSVAWSISDPYRHAQALAQLAGIFASAGRTDLVIRAPEAAETSARSAPDRRQQAEALSQVAEALAAAGLHERANATAALMPDRFNRDEILAGLAEVAAGTGEVTTDRPVVTADPRQQAEILTAQAELLLGAGELGAARQMAVRAEAVVRSITDRSSQAGELLRLAEALASMGDRHRAALAVRRALADASPGSGASLRVPAPLLTRLVQVLAVAGHHEEAERLARSAGDTRSQAEALIAIAGVLPDGPRRKLASAVCLLAMQCDVEMWPHDLITRLLALTARSGLGDQALDIARRCASRRTRLEYLEYAAEALMAAGQHDRLEGLYLYADPDDRDQLRALTAQLLIEGGMHGRGQAILGSVTDLRWKSAGLGALAVDLARTGRYDTAERLARLLPNPDWRGSAVVRVARELAAAGLYDRAEALARSVKSGRFGEEPLADVTGLLASAGRHEQAKTVALSISQPELRATALVRITAELASSGDEENAARAAEQAEKSLQQILDPVTQALYTIELARTLAAAGQQDRAGSIFSEAEKLTRSVSSDKRSEEVHAELADALATAGQLEKALATIFSITDQALQSKAVTAVMEKLTSRDTATCVTAEIWTHVPWTVPLAAAASIEPLTITALADDIL